MAGTILNMITVLIGSLLGLALGSRLPQTMQVSVIQGVGLVTIVVGVQNSLRTGNIIIPLLAIVFGVIIGEWLNLAGRLEELGSWLQKRLGGGESAGESARERFITGWVTASLVFCIGPLTIIGSIQDGMGLAAGFQFLAIKSTLDGFTSMAFASSFGVGVIFSVLTILIIQGGLALMGWLVINLTGSAELVASLENSPAILEMTAVGGIILIGLALILLDIKPVRMANFLPALLVAPALVGLAGLLGIPVYPL